MDGTARRERDRALTAIRIFLAVRRTRSALAALIVGAVLTAVFGRYEAPVPVSATHGQAVLPLWRLLAVSAAVVPVLALQSRLADLELPATRRLRRHQRGYLAVLGLAGALAQLGAAAVTLDPPLLLVVARSMLAWWGLALLAGVLLGWQLAWTLPTLAAVVLWYWGYQGDGRYAWWEFTARPHDDLPSLLLSLALLGCGLVAYAATPWRRRRWALRRRMARPGVRPRTPPRRTGWSTLSSAVARRRARP